MIVVFNYIVYYDLPYFAIVYLFVLLFVLGLSHFVHNKSLRTQLIDNNHSRHHHGGGRGDEEARPAKPE